MKRLAVVVLLTLVVPVAATAVGRIDVPLHFNDSGEASTHGDLEIVCLRLAPFDMLAPDATEPLASYDFATSQACGLSWVTRSSDPPTTTPLPGGALGFGGRSNALFRVNDPSKFAPGNDWFLLIDCRARANTSASLFVRHDTVGGDKPRGDAIAAPAGSRPFAGGTSYQFRLKSACFGDRSLGSVDFVVAQDADNGDFVGWKWLQALPRCPDKTPKLPPLAGAKPVFFQIPAGATHRLAVVDSPLSATGHYTRMRIDLNGNRDLTDDPEIVGKLASPDADVSAVDFGSIALDCEIEGSRRTCRSILFGYSTARPAAARAFGPAVMNACSYRGILVIGGRTYHVAVDDANGNGVYGDIVPDQPWERDRLSISPASNPRDSVCVPVCDLLWLDGVLYELSVDARHGRMSLTPGPMGMVPSYHPKGTTSTALLRAGTTQTLAAVWPSGIVHVPAGQWKTMPSRGEWMDAEYRKGLEKDPKRCTKAEEEAKARRARISKELAETGTHAWAGEYYSGDGLGVNISLSIAPESGFLFEWHGCMGLYDRNYGGVVEEAGRLRLEFELENRRVGFQGIAGELNPVSWGDRHYLVEPDRMLDFVNAVNSGSEPRTRMHGTHLLRKGDEKTTVTGPPSLPPAAARLLRSEPIDATIVSVDGHSVRPMLGGGEFRDTTVTLSAGAAAGVFPGMEFSDIDGRFFCKARVALVSDGESTAVTTRIIDAQTTPAVGWKLTNAPYRLRRQ